ncbi:MAG: NAD regulator [Actinomycetota bacterium]
MIVTVTDDEPNILVVRHDLNEPGALPSGPLDPERDLTLDKAVRRWLALQTGVEVSYVEQLYTFGDRSRSAAIAGERELAVGYVALVAEEPPSEGSSWEPVYDLFPWEDHRFGQPDVLTGHLVPRLEEWAVGDDDRQARVQITFGIGTPWDPIRVLERYELLHEAGLVHEHFMDQGDRVPDDVCGMAMAGDHRRIAATALGRLRGKLTYRPVIFEVMPEEFTLTELQRAVEAITGFGLHKQNFRRLVDRGELVEPTGGHRSSTGGRPAALYRFRSDVASERPRPGFPLPHPKQL